MPKTKLLIYIGLLLLSIGIVLRYSMENSMTSSLFIYSGIALKASYLILIILKGKFKPGIEILFLFIGLSLVFSGSRMHNLDMNPYLTIAMMGVGGMLKLLFIVLFSRKLRQRSNKN